MGDISVLKEESLGGQGLPRGVIAGLSLVCLQNVPRGHGKWRLYHVVQVCEHVYTCMYVYACMCVCKCACTKAFFAKGGRGQNEKGRQPLLAGTHST